MLHDFLIQLVIVILGLAISFVTPYLFQFFGSLAKNQKYAGWIKLAEIVVKSVEQQMIGKSGADKKRAVELYLANKLKGVSVDDMNHIIEAAVYAIKQQPGISTNINNNDTGPVTAGQ